MEVQGKLLKSLHQKQNVELKAENIRVVGPCDTVVCGCISQLSKQGFFWRNQFLSLLMAKACFTVHFLLFLLYISFIFLLFMSLLFNGSVGFFNSSVDLYKGLLIKEQPNRQVHRGNRKLTA